MNFGDQQVFGLVLGLDDPGLVRDAERALERFAHGRFELLDAAFEQRVLQELLNAY